MAQTLVAWNVKYLLCWCKVTPGLDPAPHPCVLLTLRGPAGCAHSLTASRRPRASDAGAGGTRSSGSSRAHIIKNNNNKTTKIASRLRTQQAENSAGTAWSQSWIRDHYATCRRVFHCVLSGCASPARCHSPNSYLGAVGYEIIIYFGNIYITVEWLQQEQREKIHGWWKQIKDGSFSFPITQQINVLVY